MAKGHLTAQLCSELLFDEEAKWVKTVSPYNWGFGRVAVSPLKKKKFFGLISETFCCLMQCIVGYIISSLFSTLSQNGMDDRMDVFVRVCKMF